jgi:hypothetical protein
MTSSETRLHSGEGTVRFEMVGDLFINLVFKDFRKDGYTVEVGSLHTLRLESLKLIFQLSC